MVQTEIGDKLREIPEVTRCRRTLAIRDDRIFSNWKTIVIAVSGLIIFSSASATELDTDNDGLEDFLEIHKYFTNPQKLDSDGDGVPDGDWHERREFTYTVRTVIKVMYPCNTNVINDDYQDGRVLAETDKFVELEVIHYPLNTMAGTITGINGWQDSNAAHRKYLKAGRTTNWDDEMRVDLLEQLQKSGIEPQKLTDQKTVQKVSRWLLASGNHRNMFGTYFIDFSDEKARIFPGLEEAFRRQKGNTTLPFNQHLQHEVFGKGMFKHKSYGTCTSEFGGQRNTEPEETQLENIPDV